MEKNYRIHTNITADTLVNVNMQQDFDFLEILSLKLRQKDAYRLHSSNYGVVVGRVLANDAFGIPNAKVSVFIERDSSDPVELRNVYPYSEVMSRDNKGRRYNLLPDYSDDSCYKVVGTFPRKRYLLDDSIQLEVYEKYWKYTTVTNQAGDYMLFGVPEGGQQIHVDIDLSDIGILSQKPRDFIYKGYDLNEFDSPSQFKDSTNLDGLTQIISQNKAIVVYPFWGDASNGIAAITRCDVQVNYKFEPTCVFMGSIISDNDTNAIGHKCAAEIDSGLNSQLIAGEGRIEMIRKTTDGLVEEYPIMGNALIDSDGVWCYQIPMNLDYIGTDEYGNIVATDNPSKGIPTRTQVRFRISKVETGEEGYSRHTAKYLVPMNPILDESEVVPTTQEDTGMKMEQMYNFGSNTPAHCFRDLYWNNVYSVKNYIPKVQASYKSTSKNYGALKGANLVDNQNPVPFNKLRIDMPFSYMIVCILFTVVMMVVSVINWVIKILMEVKNFVLPMPWPIPDIPIFGWIPEMGCIPLNAGLGDSDGIAYYPGCGCPGSYACDYSDCPEEMDNICTKESDNDKLLDKIQQALAEDYKIVKLDFYQDWLNGALYMPLWFWRKRKKKTFLFFTISGAKNEFCSCDKRYKRLRTYVTCNVEYNDLSMGTDSSIMDGDRWHKTKRDWVRYFYGLIKPVENKDGLTAYYYVGFQATSDNAIDTETKNRVAPFHIIKLYATDIILLGNLNENNIYGIPQFFKILPSTTANIPPIATIQENTNDSEVVEYNQGDLDTVSNDEDKGSTITTGMDWGHDGGDQVPVFKNGLFMDLACTYAATRAKSCINAERLSELGVNLDTTYDMSYAQSAAGLKSGKMDSDGFINKLELDDLDNRATFATLNHIGFVPQDYQNSIGGYETQVIDENTGYLIPKFKYVYPVDFDGRMKYPMRVYRRGFNQGLYDEIDESYLTFRLGAEKNSDKDENLEERVRHFYNTEVGYSMPLYNNSFYFYFGINKGNTAIDKFNKMFYAPCVQKNKNPFSFNIEAKGKAYCTSTYDEEKLKACRNKTDIDTTGYNGYGYIRFTSDDIITPFSYTLYDSAGNVVVPTEDGMNDTDFVIGGIITEDGKIQMNDKGVVKFHNEDKEVPNKYKNGLTNQIYTMEIVDDNGRKLSERIELNVPKIVINYDTIPLGAKFYDTATTRMDYICNDENELYGMIRLLSFNVDGFEYYITEGTPISYDADLDAYKILIRGVAGERNDDAREQEDKFKTLYCASAIVNVAAINSSEVGMVRDCLCDVENKIFNTNGRDSFISDTITQYWFGLREPTEDDIVPGLTGKQVIPTLFVYQPNRFSLTIAQYCEVDGIEVELEDNVTSEIATVMNGENFNAFLNDMPVKFMLGTVTDSSGAVVSNQSRFYSSTVVTNPNSSNISGWYGLHEETTYRWDMSENMVLGRNEYMWRDFVELQQPINHHASKIKILRFKFDTMFSLSNGSYVIDRIPTLQYVAKGGNKKLLYRDVAPDYSDTNGFRTIYRLADENTVTVIKEFPNIVGSNYSGHTGDGDGPHFNRSYTESDRVGNYFAVFTNNGGYTSKTEVDESAKVMKIPGYTKVTPWKANFHKKLGSDEYNNIRMFEPAYDNSNYRKYQPYLRGMFVDRRLDHNLMIMAPTSSLGNTHLYPLKKEGDKWVEDNKERLWRNARICGSTFNGLEMSYDKDYNIVSADTLAYYYVPAVDSETIFPTYEEAINFAKENLGITDDSKAAKYVKDYGDATATKNRRLEYSYSFSDVDEDATTCYNAEDNMIWEEDAYDVVEYDDDGNATVVKKGDSDGQIIKRFYEASFNGADIREFFWSDYNRERLNRYIREQRESYEGLSSVDMCAAIYNYGFKYPYEITSLYNGDFNRLDALNGNYPTKRFIDMCNIPPGASYKFEIKGCTYNIKTRVNNNNTISAEVKGESKGISITTTFDNPITFIGADSSSNGYANAMYKMEEETYDGETATHFKGYSRFVMNQLLVTFSVNQSSDKTGTFNIYCASPRLIRVMPFMDINGVKLDGISAIKTATQNGEVFANIDNIFVLIHNTLTFYLYEFPSMDNWTNLSNGNDTFVPIDINRAYMSLKNGAETRTFYFCYGGTTRFVTCDSQEFQATVFRSPLLGTSYDDMWQQNRRTAESAAGVKMFAVLLEKTYMSRTDDNLTRNITTLEFSDIYDVRDILFRINNEEIDLNKKPEATSKYYTYIDKVKISSIERHETTQTDTYDEETGQKTGTEVTTDDEEIKNYTHVQVITFDFYFPDFNDPQKECCDAFANANTMSFYFTFTNNIGDTFTIDAEEPKVLIRKFDEDGEKINLEDYVPYEGESDKKDKKDKAVLLQVRWTQEMGIILDTNWKSNTVCQVFARKSDGFTYRLNKFRINVDWVSEDIDYNQDTRTSDDSKWPDGKRQVKLKIKNI